MPPPTDETIFTGVGVALVTLFADDGAVDTAATARHAARMADLGMQAIVVAGSTGEAAALDASERLDLIVAVRDAVDVPVIAGTGAPSARQAAQLTADAGRASATAALVLSPPHTQDPRPYYTTVAEAAEGLPLLGYHYPKMSAPGLSLADLADLPLLGLKDSSGDPNRLLAEVTTYEGHLYVGSSALLSLAGPIGVTGAILALANAQPEDCIAAFAGDAAAQRRLAPHHLALSPAPHGIKRQCAARWGTSRASRL